ncbi:MAG: dienelactone hydrolase family protein [Actinobacteria bacterium]|nr:dienelactone hydrolase family protein [Actinomycetota bacterium]
MPERDRADPRGGDLPWESLTTPTPRGDVQTRLHLPASATAAAVMVGGVGGGFDTPGRDLYPRIAHRLAASRVGALRVRFRNPRSLDEATADLGVGVEQLTRRGIERVALVGHSFGGAVVVRVAARTDAVVTVVTLATQSYGAEAVSGLGHRPLLLVHAANDRVLPAGASRSLAARASGPADVRILPSAGHDLLEARDEVLTLVSDWLVAHLA